ncbi:MAG: hypothetical protein DRI95_00145 [Bacteroidetes bacterium]|nr:MAG: hypothetical protein DRI95_00145 [Bacteroidota bacterium]
MKQENAKLRKKMQRMIAKWERSGASLRAFGKTEGVSYAKLRYWKRKFKGLNQGANEESINLPQDIPGFISVEMPNIITDFTGLELSFPNNVKITCPSGIGIEELKTLIKLF